MKKSIVIILFFAVILAVSCKNIESSAEQAKAITVSTPYGDGDGNYQNFVAARDYFIQNTGTSISDLSEKSSEKWKQKIISDLENGTGADVVCFFTGADANVLIEKNLVVSISEIRKTYSTYADNMKDSMLPVSSVDGRQYAVSVNGYWEGLFINKTVLADCGIAVPGADYTWEQFLLDCEVIRGHGYTPIACALGDIPHYWFEFATFNNGNLSNHNTLPKSASDAAGQQWAMGLRDIKELYERGFFPDDTLTAKDSETAQLMLENKAAFMLDGSWTLGAFEKSANPNNYAVTYAPAKGARRATDIIGGLSMGYYISRKAWDDPVKRELCVNFVNAMTTDDVVSTFGSLSVTALKNGTNPPVNADSLILSAMEMNTGCTGVAPAVQDNLSAAGREYLFENIARVVTGEMTAEQVIAECLVK